MTLICDMEEDTSRVPKNEVGTSACRIKELTKVPVEKRTEEGTCRKKKSGRYL